MLREWPLPSSLSLSLSLVEDIITALHASSTHDVYEKALSAAPSLPPSFPLLGNVIRALGGRPFIVTNDISLAGGRDEKTAGVSESLSCSNDKRSREGKAHLPS